jgi:WD40 repeat protein
MRQTMRRLPLILLSALLFSPSLTPPAHAQYFGRNKVQYKTFTFEVLKTDHFDVYFYDEERESAKRVAQMAERWYARLSHVFNHEIRTRQPLILYASHPDFEQTNVVGGEIGEGTGGITEGLKRRVVMPLAATLHETDHVLGHELVHAFQYDISARRAQAGGSGGGIEALPLWFIEGLAEYLSIGPIDPHTAMWIRDASRQEELPRIKDLDSGRFFPYRWGQALWAYLGGKYGDEVVPQIYRDALRSGSIEVALKNASALEEKELSAAWHAAIREQYGPVRSAAERAAAFGRLVTVGDRSRNATNVSPAISPDGRHIVYFSSRDLLSIDLFLAEAATGRIVRKLVDTAVNPHFTSLQFISSAGSWSPDSRQFVIGGVHAGKPVLAIIDVEDGDVVREIEVPSAGEILNPSWSPDGRSIAFSATVGGDSDLFIYDLQAGAERRLTSDLFADLQPAWAPDGRQIAFVTDRFSTRADSLQTGEYQLALFDVGSNRIQPLRTFAHGKNINPQWSADGRRLYFVSDQSGISNVYAIDVQSGSVAQITNVDAGVSGITALSPAISSAAGSAALAISAYEDSSYHIYLIDAPARLAGMPVVRGGEARLTAAGLPPIQRQSSIARLLEDPSTGLAPPPADVEPYRARLSLDAVGQPYVTAGVDRFGGMVGGGVAFNWSDMLGDHNLFAQVNADTYGSGFNDIANNTGGLLFYTNLKKRLNWGVVLEQSPYFAGVGYAAGFDRATGDFVEQEIIQRQVSRGVSGLLAYPFSRTHRLELTSGFSTTSFDEQVRTVSFTQSGRLIGEDTQTRSLGDPLRMATVSTALVSDNSLFGATSPIAGYRSRFEISPNLGSLRMTNALVDVRKYFMPARFYTFAVRGLHFGRYGAGGEDSRLIPLFIGYPEFVRGYNIGSIEASECPSDGTCPVFDRLVGSRMLVGNLEFRFPLLRPFGVGERMYGPLPVEVAFFVDGGVAWSRGQKPFESTRKPVSSGGLSLRTSLLGFAIAQIDFARPFDRPGRGWIWGFSLTPGF